MCLVIAACAVSALVPYIIEERQIPMSTSARAVAEEAQRRATFSGFAGRSKSIARLSRCLLPALPPAQRLTAVSR